MLLKDIKETEFKLLIIEDKKNDMDFNDYLKLEEILDKIGNITDLYVKYMEKYGQSLSQYDTEERINMIKEKNNSLLETDIEIDLTIANKIMEKYKV